MSDGTESSSAVAPASLNVALIAAPTLNFAAEQSGVPVISSVRISNQAESALVGARLEVAIEPDLVAHQSFPIPPVRAGDDLELDALDLRLPPGRLRGVIETERAALRWRVLVADQTVASGDLPLEVLAWHHWPGLRAPPALLASFVLPNHPVVARLLVRVRERLREASGDPALTGYQTRSPARVRAMVEAVHLTLQDLGLTYIGVPASFEEAGQKVRLPDMLLDDQMGNCLDLTLLIAAALEQMGLAPLIVVLHRHALPAVWLVDDRFPEGVVYDVARLRNLIALGELLAFEATATVAAERPPFAVAVASALAALEDNDRYVAAIDVRVAREDRFRPLPIRMTVDPDDTVASEATPTLAHTLLVEAERESEPAVPKAPAAPPEPVVARFKRWKDRLLDLSLRNKLLNFRSGRGGVPLLVPDLARLEDGLASDRLFEVVPRPPVDPRDARSASLVATREDPAELRARHSRDLEARVLHADVAAEEFYGRAVELDRAARVEREEGGANVLFLALGLLRWFESDASELPRLAPLVLVPVRLELERAARRVRVRRTEDDPIGNVTLAEKMRRDFGVDLASLAAMEADESGVDIPGLLQRARLAIKGRPRWEIVEEAHLGLFTFARFLLWKDLEDNADILLENPVVGHIAMGGQRAFPDPVGEPDVRTMDDEAPPAELPVVMDADSTQLSAILAASRGRSFVLQGPPGTGKSQTISNLIAVALARGRTVLFVSEKMAALDVVHRRLVASGLGDFCLELHSNKANKKQVADTLGRSLARASAARPPDWLARAAELSAERATLNAYVRALHAPRPLGQSYYLASARLLALDGAPKVPLKVPEVANLTEPRWRAMLEAARALAIAARPVEPVAQNPWRISALSTWSNAAEERAQEALAAATLAIREAMDAAHQVADTWGEPGPTRFEALGEVVALADAVATGPVPEIALAETWPSTAERVRTYIAAVHEDKRQRQDLDQRWADALHQVDLATLGATFRSWAGAFFLFALLFLWGPRRRLRAIATQGLPANPQIADDLETATRLRDARPGRAAEGEALRQLLGPAAKDGEVATLETLLARVERIRGVRAQWCAEGRELPPRALALLDPAVPMARRVSVAKASARLNQAEAGLRASMDEVQATLSLRTPLLVAATDLGALLDQLTELERGLGRLRAWCQYRHACGEAEVLGLGPIVRAHEDGQVLASEIVAATERAVLTAWTRAVCDAEPALRTFSGEAHHERVERFRKADQDFLSLARRHVAAELEARRPQIQGNASESSEPGILLRETRKKTRHLPLRRLFQSIPNLLPRLRPCLLMSPLSVAQYLPARGRRFDIVVFDEASQIGTHEAIGAIARGDQVVIVGDSRQLPPTAFFTRALDDDAVPDDNDVVELESILDEAVAARLPQQMLGWHYRSRHEALIDFSNRHYYENRLNVFPAARGRVPDLGVQWCPVPDGVYDKGKTRTNEREAAALVAWLVSELRRHPPGQTTYGVVTFSLPQQTLIQDMLDRARVEHPEIEPHFSDAQLEPVFVKNLENVQGDERDVILFSVCYGPDERGKVWMNFGPLNRAGGERRLNVAITRARRLLRVYSALTADAIDLSRTAAVGARHLRAFLQYVAEHGGLQGRPRRVGEFESEFERQVHDALIALGYQVECQVGCGGYRIDLAVVHPTRHGEFVLGVECDGAPYHSAATARDRDRLRQQVLEELGWRLHRVWSTDWWRNREVEQERLRKAVEDAIQEADAEPLELEPPELPELPEPSAEPPMPVVLAPAETVEPYVPAMLAWASDNGEDFYGWGVQPQIRDRVLKVIDAEAPIHLDELVRRVSACWGLKRLTDRARGHVGQLVEGLSLLHRLTRRGDFLWRASDDPAAWRRFRGPTADGTPRDAASIAPEEIAAATATILRSALSLPEAELARDTARLFGIARLGRLVEERMQAGIDLLCQQGRAIREGGRVEWRAS